MTRNELIELGKKIVNGQGSEEELTKLYEQFNKSVPHPNGASLFFYPENYNPKTDNISKYNPSIEEVVDKALSYKPVILPPNTGL